MNKLSAAIATGGILITTGLAAGQAVTTEFECAYRFDDLGTPPGVPGSLGGLVFQIDDPNTLLIGGRANASNAEIFAVPVIRDKNNRVVGFGPASTVFASSPNIDGGLTYGPDGVLLFSRYNMNELGQLLPGSTMMDRSVDLDALGYTGSVGALTVVPDGFRGAGRLKVLPFNSSTWHDGELTPDGNGTFDVSAPTSTIPLSGGPEGIVYVEAGAPLFPNESVLISEYSAQVISAYETDAVGDPVPGTRRVFMQGIPGAEGGARDPITGDFFFSTFGGGNRVLVVRGFVPDSGCMGNFNADCVTNVFDILDFLTEWNNGGDRADWDDSGTVNIFDILAFLTDWNACE